jgi:hypothetical protein
MTDPPEDPPVAAAAAVDAAVDVATEQATDQATDVGVDAASDEALLRRFAPVLRLTSGELFLPGAIEHYLEHAALVRDAGKAEQVLAEAGTLTPAILAGLGKQHRDKALSLRYVSESMDARQYRAWRSGGGPAPFRRASAAAAAGLIARVVAALMRLSLLLRGQVPGGHTAVAYKQSRTGAAAGTCHYYGHVIREGGYVVLQYWFFYPMNDWRSSFGGVNDHEADWEQVSVVLAQGNGTAGPEPVWVALASHDERGADLRRRWDDDDLQRVGEHPVVYVGAGSHSAACLPGEYLVTVAPDLPAWVRRWRTRVARILPWWDPDAVGVGIPFLDYRRGDGWSIGPGQDLEWHPHLVDDSTGWVRDYRGLWGLDTGDPLGGERAPAGPRYDRDGSVRQSWGEPLAWMDLDGEPATEGEAARLWRRRPVQLESELVTVQEQVIAARQALRAATVADRAAGRPTLQPSPERRDLLVQVAELRRRQCSLEAALDALDGDAAGQAPPRPGPRDHLRHRAVPLGQDRLARSRALRVWTSASGAILLAALGLLLLAGGPGLLVPVVGLVLAMLLIEGLLRRRLLALVVNLALVAAVVAAIWWVLTLVVGNLRAGVGVLLLATAVYMGVQTIADALLHRQPRR